MLQEPFEQLVIDCEAASGRHHGVGVAPGRTGEHGARRQGPGAAGVHRAGPGVIEAGFHVRGRGLSPVAVSRPACLLSIRGPVGNAERIRRGSGISARCRCGQRQDPGLFLLATCRIGAGCSVDPNVENMRGSDRRARCAAAATTLPSPGRSRKDGKRPLTMCAPPEPMRRGPHPAVRHTLEQALGLSRRQNWSEVTPGIRLPQKLLLGHGRRRAGLAPLIRLT